MSKKRSIFRLNFVKKGGVGKVRFNYKKEVGIWNKWRVGKKVKKDEFN